MYYLTRHPILSGLENPDIESPEHEAHMDDYEKNTLKASSKPIGLLNQYNLTTRLAPADRSGRPAAVPFFNVNTHLIQSDC